MRSDWIAAANERHVAKYQSSVTAPAVPVRLSPGNKRVQKHVQI
jgi:hypothetical protein